MKFALETNRVQMWLNEGQHAISASQQALVEGAVGDHHVFRHTQVREEIELLKNHRHPARLRGLGIGWSEGLAIEKHLPGVRRKDPGKDFSQGTFTRAIFAHDRMHFAGTQSEAAIRECDDAAETLGDTFSDEERFGDGKMPRLRGGNGLICREGGHRKGGAGSRFEKPTPSQVGALENKRVGNSFGTALEGEQAQKPAPLLFGLIQIKRDTPPP